jgi:hypothetical protein
MKEINTKVIIFLPKFKFKIKRNTSFHNKTALSSPSINC